MIKLVIFLTAVVAALSAPADERAAKILRQEQDVAPDSYSYAFETENGIKGEERGQHTATGPETGNLVAQGGFSFTHPENIQNSIQYVADENGFQPSGNLLPTPPPIPVAIQRALDWIAAHPERPEPTRFA